MSYSNWLHPAVANLKQVKDWTEIESVVEFMRFENVDDDPEPSWSAHPCTTIGWLAAGR